MQGEIAGTVNAAHGGTGGDGTGYAYGNGSSRFTYATTIPAASVAAGALASGMTATTPKRGRQQHEAGNDRIRREREQPSHRIFSCTEVWSGSGTSRRLRPGMTRFRTTPATTTRGRREPSRPSNAAATTRATRRPSIRLWQRGNGHHDPERGFDLRVELRLLVIWNGFKCELDHRERHRSRHGRNAHRHFNRCDRGVPLLMKKLTFTSRVALLLLPACFGSAGSHHGDEAQRGGWCRGVDNLHALLHRDAGQRNFRVLHMVYECSERRFSILLRNQSNFGQWLRCHGLKSQTRTRLPVSADVEQWLAHYLQPGILVRQTSSVHFNRDFQRHSDVSGRQL